MKIAHINYIPYDNVIGVEKKLEEQATAALELGLNIDFIVLNSKIDKIDKNFKLIKLKTSQNNFISKVQKKLFKFNLIKDSVNLDKYDYIILRYPGMDFSSLVFIKKYGNKLITEHHTNEIGEIGSSNQDITIKLKLLLEIFQAPRFLKEVKGIIAVTNEIREIELAKTIKILPSCVVSNGINVENIKFTEFRKFDDKELTIIFVASYFSSWQGLKKLLNGLIEYNGNIRINLLLIGDLSGEDWKLIKSIKKEDINIEILGRKYGDELNEYYEKSNLAVSSLSLFEKNMKEACSLKTREYLARGIPFIYGYDDSDLKGDEIFALKIDTTKENVNISKLIKFVKNLNEFKEVSIREREYAENNIDWKIKISQMYDFVKTLNV